MAVCAEQRGREGSNPRVHEPLARAVHSYACGGTKKKRMASTRTASATKSASKSASSGKRERIDTTPNSAGGSRFIRRDANGRFTSDQVSVGRSLAADRRQQAKTKAPKGQKDRGD